MHVFASNRSRLLIKHRQESEEEIMCQSNR